MSEAVKILSITIPTWNRARILPGILDQLCNEVVNDNIENDIELFITNNGSDDNTEEICLQYKNKFNFISYHNNGINIGARDNVLKCFEMAKGHYTILFGDDDRINPGSIKNILQILKSTDSLDLILDSAVVKSNPFNDGAFISLKQLVDNFYYYIGNAGLFIYKTELAKNVFRNHLFSFFNKSWPQTQLMILGIKDIHKPTCLLKNLKINAPGLHGEVMVYSSYYLYRTTYYDLIDSIEAIKSEIDPAIYSGARSYLKSNLFQIFLNILQCGIFVDDEKTKEKTREHILEHLSYFKSIEKTLMLIIAIVLWLPSFLSKPMSNFFIFILKGRAGLKKKNDFVISEMMKKLKQNQSKINEVREFSF